MNLDYEKILASYNRIPFFIKSDFMGLGQSLYVGEWNRKFNDALTELFYEKFPKLKKIDLFKLGDEVINPIREEYKNRCINTYAKKVKQSKLLANLLNKLAAEIEVIPQAELYLIHTANSSTYSSQPQHNFYAKQSLLEYTRILQSNGFKFEIRQVNEYKSNGMYPDIWYDYELWANILPWQWDILLRKETYDPLQWSIQCWKSGINPKVLNPFLDDEIYYQSSEMWNK